MNNLPTRTEWEAAGFKVPDELCAEKRTGPKYVRLEVRFEVDLPESQLEAWAKHFCREIKDSVEESVIINGGQWAVGEVRKKEHIYTKAIRESVLGRWEQDNARTGLKDFFPQPSTLNPQPV